MRAVPSLTPDAYADRVRGPHPTRPVRVNHHDTVTIRAPRTPSVPVREGR